MNTWIFQGNPDQFELDSYLRVARRIIWTVRQIRLAPQMQIGDRLFVWRAAGRQRLAAGIVASGWLVEAPREQAEDPAALPLWRVASPDRALRVQADINRVARGPREVIQREWLLHDPVLANLRVLKFRTETNYLIDPRMAARLEALWRNTGRDWTRAESVAGLWAYHKTYSLPVSRSPGSPVAVVAERIGRAVTGVYNKVMNFRALDPRDTRTGLMAGGEVDRAVWDRFYDSQTQRIRADELEVEFDRLWPAGSEAEPETVSAEDLVTASVGREGQGFIGDPAVRQAVERRAMALATEHYGQFFGTVQDVSNVRPYDLCCLGDGMEVHVEVKGSTGDVGEIRLTLGEVLHARTSEVRTDLFLVSGIRVRPGAEGPRADGGEVRILETWVPKDDDLKALVFRYRVPG